MKGEKQFDLIKPEVLVLQKDENGVIVSYRLNKGDSVCGQAFLVNRRALKLFIAALIEFDNGGKKAGRKELKNTHLMRVFH